MPVTLTLLAIALISTAALGPMGLGTLAWRVSPSGLVQLYGAHIAELALVVPAALASAWLWPRIKHPAHRIAPPLALGSAAYALYVAVQFVLFPDYSLHSGNNERFFPLFLATVILAWLATARSWRALRPPPSPLPLRLIVVFAGVVLATNALIGLAWSSQVLSITAGGALPPDYAAAPTGFWVIRLVDLGVIIPLSVATALGVLRRHPTATRAAPAIASFLTLEVGAVLAMGFAQLWLHDPTASVGLVASLAPIFLALATTTILLLRFQALARTCPGEPLPEIPGSLSGGTQPERGIPRIITSVAGQKGAGRSAAPSSPASRRLSARSQRVGRSTGGAAGSRPLSTKSA